MSDDTTTESHYQEYLDDLSNALRSRGVSADRIDSILEEVSFQVVSTGEPPYETYGMPDEYADQVAATEDTGTKQRRSLTAPDGLTGKLPEGIDPVAPAVGVFGGACLAGGALALGTGQSWFAGVPAFLGLVLGIGLAIYALVRAVPDSFRDPTTGETSIGEHSRPAMVPAIFLAVLVVGLVLVGALVG